LPVNAQSDIVRTAAAPPPPTLTGGTIAPPGSFNLTLNGQSGRTYIMLYTTDLRLPVSSWIALSTHTLTGSYSNLACSVPDSTRFYGAQWAGY
jgi:hypothetical protein